MNNSVINRPVAYVSRVIDDFDVALTGRALMIFVDSDGDPAILIERPDGTMIQRFSELVKFIDVTNESWDKEDVIA